MSLCRSRFETEANDAAAAFFVDSLEEWAVQLGLDRFTLVGHSLGGYLSARYAMAHPSRIEGLVLASPAGLTTAPTETAAKTPTERTPTSAVPWQLRLLDTAWSANVTPGQIFRAWSYLRRGGPPVVEGILRRRFGDRWPAHETALIANYLYHITAQPGSGEFAMNSLLVPIFPRAGSARLALSFGCFVVRRPQRRRPCAVGVCRVSCSPPNPASLQAWLAVVAYSRVTRSSQGSTHCRSTRRH